MQRSMQNKTYYAQTVARKSKLRSQYNQSSFDVDQNSSALNQTQIKEPITPLDAPARMLEL